MICQTIALGNDRVSRHLIVVGWDVHESTKGFGEMKH
jgi:hypothetical protein